MPGIERSVVRRLPSPPVYQWECTCRVPPVVLGSYDLTGRISLIDHERYWHVESRVATNCPKCGKQHMLDLAIDPSILATLPRPWRDGGD